MNAPVRPPDEDVAFFMEVQKIKERYKRNSQSGGMVATSKDQDKSGETLADGVGLIQRIASKKREMFVEMTWQWIIERIKKAKSKKEAQNDCVTDDDDNFLEGPGKGRSGGQSGGKGIRRPGGIGGTGAAKSACDVGSPSRLETEVTETEVGVDVVLVTPPQSKNKHTRVTEDNDDDAVGDTPIPQPAAFQGEEVLTKAGDNVSGTPTDVARR
ncbi:hypothetical protein HID58_046205 [Brassica napus]|uniref:Uncharacterized protein n=1 Tax=Brassica napus TaxID=3708 RepID=A0ABQ8AVW1_BRANA|nr:hypothetical protein HID58_046205 [Brassica napus]